MSDDINIDDLDLTAMLKEFKVGVGHATRDLDEAIGPLLGESPDAWYGAGVFSTWVQTMITDTDLDIQQILFGVALQVKAIQDHPMALKGLAMRRKRGEF